MHGEANGTCTQEIEGGKRKRKGGEERETTFGANGIEKGENRRDSRTISEIRHIIKSAGCFAWSPFGSTRIRLTTASDHRQI